MSYSKPLLRHGHCTKCIKIIVSFNPHIILKGRNIICTLHIRKPGLKHLCLTKITELEKQPCLHLNPVQMCIDKPAKAFLKIASSGLTKEKPKEHELGNAKPNIDQ